MLFFMYMINSTTYKAKKPLKVIIMVSLTREKSSCLSKWQKSYKAKKILINPSPINIHKEIAFKFRENKCDICNAILQSKETAKSHYNGKPHKKKVEQFSKMARESSDAPPILKVEQGEVSLHKQANEQEHVIGVFGNCGMESLPEEILLRVFRWLPLRDLKTVVLVSQRWRTIGEDPCLWKCFRFIVRKRKRIRNFYIGRFQRMQAIRIKSLSHLPEFSCDEQILDRIKLPRLKEIYLNGLNLTLVKPAFLGMLTTELEVLNLSKTRMANEQIKALFTGMLQNHQLKKLDLSENQLSPLEPKLFAKVVSRLEDVNLKCTHITCYHIWALLTEMRQNHQLKKLDLSENQLPPLEPELFAKVVSRVEDVNLRCTDITSLHAQALFAEILSTNCRLKKLDLRITLSCKNDFNKLDLSLVEPKLFARAINKLVDVNLSGTAVSYLQLQALFVRMCRNSQLKKLDLHRGFRSKDGLRKNFKKKLGNWVKEGVSPAAVEKARKWLDSGL